MNRKKKTELSFADSSVQGRSADVNDDDDVISEDPMRGPPPPTRKTTTSRVRDLLPNWMVAGSSSNDKPQSDGASSEDKFVVLPPTARRSGRNKGNHDADWQPQGDDDFLDDEDEIVIEEDDDFEPSSSRVGKKPNLNHRKHLQMKREQDRLKREREQQEADRRQFEAEEEELMRVIELSRLAAEEEARQKEQEAEFLASINFKDEVSNDNGQRLKVIRNRNSSNSNHGSRRGGGVAGSSGFIDPNQENMENSFTSKRNSRPHSQEMEWPGQSSNHSEELIDVEEEESTLMSGGFLRNSQSPSMFSTPDIEEVNSHPGMNTEVPSSTSGVSLSGRPRERKQETIDQALIRATCLGLRKRPLEDIQTSTNQPRKILRAVAIPRPPDLSTLDDLTADMQDERRVVTRGRQAGSRAGSQHSQGGGDVGDNEDDGVDLFEAMNAEVIEEGQPLVDKRNLPDKPGLYAPKGKCIQNYTQVIFKLLRHYCIQLRKSQSRSPLQIERGAYVVPGQIFSGTLRHRKRGAKAPIPVISLSDDDDVPNNGSQDGWIEAKTTGRLGVKGNSATRKRKRPNVIDSDSDLEDFKIGNTSKSLRTSNMIEQNQMDVDVDVYNFDNVDVDEHVPLLKVDCVTAIRSSDKIKDMRDVPGTSGRADENVTGGSGGNIDAGVTSGINEDDASQTLAYDEDEYNADTEEFPKADNQANQISIDNEASSLAQNEGPATSSRAQNDDPATSSLAQNKDPASDEDTKEPSTSGASAASSRSVSKDRRPSPVASQEASQDIDSRETNMTDVMEKDDPCLVDSTTLSVLRKSRQLKRKSGSPSSQSAQNGPQGAVSSSEAQGNVTGADQRNRNLNTKSTLTNSKESEVKSAADVEETASTSNEVKSPGIVEEMASTSESRSSAERTKEESDEVETSSESKTKVPRSRTSPVDDEVETSSESKTKVPRSRTSPMDDEVETSSESRTKVPSSRTSPVDDEVETSSESRTKVPRSRTSPVDNVSSMPKTATEDNSKQSSSSEAGGVTSSKEATPSKRDPSKRDPRVSCLLVYGEMGEKLSFEELRTTFYAKQGNEEESGVDESTTSATSNAGGVNIIENMLPDELRGLVQEACSDALAASKSESVSSSLSGNVKPGKVDAPKRTRGSSDVASTSDSAEGEVEPSKEKTSVVRTRERHARHQSPGVASSSDQAVRQRTVNSHYETETSSSSEGAAVTSRVSKMRGRLASSSDQAVRQRTDNPETEIETSSSSEGGAVTSRLSKTRGRLASSSDQAVRQRTGNPGSETETSSSSEGGAVTSRLSKTQGRLASSSDQAVRQRTVNPETETLSSSGGAAVASRQSKSQGRLASSSDDQAVKQRTVNPDHENETSSSSEGGAVASRVSKRHVEEAVESSGLDSDASGVVLKRPEGEKATAGERTLGIGSSDEATTSEGNDGTSRAKQAKLDASRNDDEASTSEDVQPITDAAPNDKEREAEPVTRHRGRQAVQEQENAIGARGRSRQILPVAEQENATSSKERGRRSPVENEDAMNAPGREAQAVSTKPTRGRRIQTATMQGETTVIGRATSPTQGDRPTRGRRIETATMQGETTIRGRGTRPIEGGSSQPVEEQMVEEHSGVAGGSNENEVQEEAIITVECPLCSYKFLVEQIEAHASECDGTAPPEEDGFDSTHCCLPQWIWISWHYPLRKTAVSTVETVWKHTPPRQTRQQQTNARTVLNHGGQGGDDIAAAATSHGDAQIDLTDELSAPNSSWNTEWEARHNSRKQPVRTYGRPPATATTDALSDSEDDNVTRPVRVPPRRKRIKPPQDDDDDEEDVTPELDHVDATIYQMAENNELQLVQPKRGVRGTRNARRSPSPEIDEDPAEQLERCFLCNKLIPRSLYQTHVNEEIDKQNSQLEDSSEGAAAGSGEGAAGDMLTGLVRPSRRTEAPIKDDNGENSTNGHDPADYASITNELINDSSDEDSDDNVNIADMSFGDSPIRAFKKISDQPNNLIDFKNQFKTSSGPREALFKATGPNAKGRGRGRGKGKRKAYRGKRGRGKRRK